VLIAARKPRYFIKSTERLRLISRVILRCLPLHELPSSVSPGGTSGEGFLPVRPDKF
jgi:hypothetical protein